MVPALGDSTGISIFIDSRIMISPSTSTLSPGLVWIFQTLPAISDSTLTTAMPSRSPDLCSTVLFGHGKGEGKRRASLPRAEPVCGLVPLRQEAVQQRRAA